MSYMTKEKNMHDVQDLARHAQAWTWGLEADDYQHPQVQT